MSLLLAVPWHGLSRYDRREREGGGHDGPTADTRDPAALSFGRSLNHMWVWLSVDSILPWLFVDRWATDSQYRPTCLSLCSGRTLLTTLDEWVVSYCRFSRNNRVTPSIGREAWQSTGCAARARARGRSGCPSCRLSWASFVGRSSCPPLSSTAPDCWRRKRERQVVERVGPSVVVPPPARWLQKNELVF